MQCHVISIFILLPSLLSVLQTSLSSDEVLTNLMSMLHNEDGGSVSCIMFIILEFGSYLCHSIAVMFSHYVSLLLVFLIQIMQDNRKEVDKTEETVLNQTTSIPNVVSFESLCEWFVREVGQGTLFSWLALFIAESENVVSNLSLVLIHSIELCKKRVLERDITNLLSQLDLLLRSFIMGTDLMYRSCICFLSRSC